MDVPYSELLGDRDPLAVLPAQLILRLAHDEMGRGNLTREQRDHLRHLTTIAGR